MKNILGEIAADSGKNAKIEILGKYKDNETLKKVIYLAHSPRVKFYIKKIPVYTSKQVLYSLDEALDMLSSFSSRDLTGGAAQAHLEHILESLTADDANVIERVIGKNLKIGMDTGINKVFPGLIEETPYMGAKPFSEKLVRNLFGDKPVFSQIKEDGTYRNAIIVDGDVELVSRSGEVSNLTDAPFLRELAKFLNCVLNGELTIDGYPRMEANGMVTSIMDIKDKAEERGEKETQKRILAFEQKHGSFEGAIQKMRFKVWDKISVDEYLEQKSSTPYFQRFASLEKILDMLKPTRISMVETRMVTSYSEAVDHFQDALKRGLEGTIVKSYDGEWKDGKPSWQIKQKNEITLDLKIVGFNYGTIGTKNEYVISTLQTESSCGCLKTNPSGMKEEMMKYITDNQDKLLNTIVEIKCCGLSQDSEGNWSTLHPTFGKLRNDKNEADSLLECIEINQMSMNLS